MSNAPTTVETITEEQIEALRTEAGVAGDEEQVALCRAALDYEPCGSAFAGQVKAAERNAARLACVEAIREAELA